MEIQHYRQKVFKTIRKYNLVEEGDIIFVAVSGGKDSTAALSIIKEYITQNEIKAEVYAYHINLGFGYSEKLQKDVEKIVEMLDVKLFVTNLKEEFDFNILKISKLTKRPVCSVCGLAKRYLMNKIPRELGAKKLATGHHAIDFLINYYKNLIHNNFEWNFKILPKLKGKHPKQLTRIRPLIFSFPEENKKYCEYKNLPLTSINCPYSPNFCCYLSRNEDNKIFEILSISEKIYSDFNLNLLKGVINFNKKYSGYDKLTENKQSNIRECKICGEPTNLETCAFCKLRNYGRNSNDKQDY